MCRLILENHLTLRWYYPTPKISSYSFHCCNCIKCQHLLADCFKCIYSTTIGNSLSYLKSLYTSIFHRPNATTSAVNQPNSTTKTTDGHSTTTTVSSRGLVAPGHSSRRSSTKSTYRYNYDYSSPRHKSPSRASNSSSSLMTAVRPLSSSDGPSTIYSSSVPDLGYYDRYSSDGSDPMATCVVQRDTPTNYNQLYETKQITRPPILITPPPPKPTPQYSHHYDYHYDDDDDVTSSSWWQSAASVTEPLPSGVPRGLVNLGNTCYMNAVIQALYSVDSIRNLILRASHDKLLTSGEYLWAKGVNKSSSKQSWDINQSNQTPTHAHRTVRSLQEHEELF